MIKRGETKIDAPIDKTHCMWCIQANLGAPGGGREIPSRAFLLPSVQPTLEAARLKKAAVRDNHLSQTKKRTHPLPLRDLFS